MSEVAKILKTDYGKCHCHCPKFDSLRTGGKAVSQVFRGAFKGRNDSDRRCFLSFSKTIQMYIFDGNPNGRIMCELSNWNGRVYKISRNELATFSNRPDAENTGIYFLFGKDENNVDTLYVGEAEKILTRLKQHLKDALYWSDCIVVVSKDNLLNKAHVKFLESKFYGLAKTAGRSVVINSTIPTCSSISE